MTAPISTATAGTPKEEPRYVDDSTCRETYAETVHVVPAGSFGLVRIELCVNRWPQDPPVRADRVVPVSRLVLPVATARALRDQLSQVLGDGVPEKAQGTTASATKLMN